MQQSPLSLATPRPFPALLPSGPPPTGPPLRPAHHPPLTSLRPRAGGTAFLPSSLLQTTFPFRLSNESLEVAPRPAPCVRLKAVPHTGPTLVTCHVALQRSSGIVRGTATELRVRHCGWQQRIGRGGTGTRGFGVSAFPGHR